MALPKSKTGQYLERTIPVPMLSAATALAAAVTSEHILFTTQRNEQFREITIWGNNTVVSGHPATNHVVAEIWNVTDATKIAAATITGTTSGTQLERLGTNNIATTSEFTGVGSNCSPNKQISLKWVGTGTLSASLRGTTLRIISDFTD